MLQQTSSSMTGNFQIGIPGKIPPLPPEASRFFAQVETVQDRPEFLPPISKLSLPQLDRTLFDATNVHLLPPLPMTHAKQMSSEKFAVEAEEGLRNQIVVGCERDVENLKSILSEISPSLFESLILQCPTEEVADVMAQSLMQSKMKIDEW